MIKTVKKAVIPAAGLGTRFLPITKAMPKEMLPIVDRPAIQYIVEEAVNSGIEEILIIKNAQKECLKTYFSLSTKNFGESEIKNIASIESILKQVKISFVDQKVQDGNGSAVLLAEDFANGEPFAVLFGDDIVYNPQKTCLSQLIDAYNKTGHSILGCQIREGKEAQKYAIIKQGDTTDRLSEVLDIAEKPTIGDNQKYLCSQGRFILTPTIFDAIRRSPVFMGEKYLTVAIKELLKTEKVLAYDFEGARYDIGDKLGYIKATIDYALRSPLGKDVAKFIVEKTKY